LAVIGLCKNAGKTVAIGRLLQEAVALGRTVGLLSTGMDGERRDSVFGHPKPPVRVTPGMWVATAREGFAAANAAFGPLRKMDIETPFGVIALAPVTQPGEITLIGPRTLSQADVVMAALRDVGADLVLVDGSIDRRSIAAAGATEAFILVVGAAFGRDLGAVVAEADRVLRLLRLPAATADVVADWPAAPDFIDPAGCVTASGVTSPLGAEAEFAERVAAAGARVVRCPGAVSGALLDGLREARALPLRLIADNGTHVFADMRTLDRFAAAGGRLEVRRSLHLAGVALNPVAPAGYRLPEAELRARLAALVPETPVFDALRD